MGVVEIGVPGVVTPRNPYDDIRLNMIPGAVGDGVNDDRPALLQAIQIAVDQGGGAIFIPPSKTTYGAYRFDKDPLSQSSINLENIVAPILFYGVAGSRMIFSGQGNGGAWSMFNLRGTQNVKFMWLDMEMGHVEFQDPDMGADPHHLIHLNNTGTPQREIANIEIAFCTFHFTRGDHIRMWAENGSWVRNVRIHHNDMFGTSTLGVVPATTAIRSCLQVNRNCDEIDVTHNYMARSNKSEIDFELTGPEGSGGCRHFKVDYNFIHHDPPNGQAGSAVGLSGNGPNDPNAWSSFSRNTLVHGTIQTEQLHGCTIDHNVIIDDVAAVNPTLHLNGRISDVSVHHNKIYRLASNSSPPRPVVYVQHGGGTIDVPRNLRLEDNDIYQEHAASVIFMEGVTGDEIIRNNRIYYNGPNYVPGVGGTGNIFHLQVESDGKTPAANLYVEENKFLGTGVTRACSHINANVGNLGHLKYHGNMHTQAGGIGLELNRGAAFTISSLSMQGNHFNTVGGMTPWDSAGGQVFTPCIGGNLGAIAQYECSGSPEGVIAAPVGSMAFDRTNGRLYFKTTGTGNTGWVQITIP